MPAIRLQRKQLLIKCPKAKADVTIEGCKLCEAMKKIAFSKVICNEEETQEKPEKKEITQDKKINIVYFDLETKKLISDELMKNQNQVPLDPLHFANLGMSVGITFNTLRSDYNIYYENNVQSLIHELLVADAIVGFNHQKFDYSVLSAYMNRPQIKSLFAVKTLDLMLDLQGRLGHRVSLDSCVNATLGESKSGDGIQAVKWFEEGKLDLIVEYCKKDVDVTRRLHEFGVKNKHIKFMDKFKVQTRSIFVDWEIK